MRESFMSRTKAEVGIASGAKVNGTVNGTALATAGFRSAYCLLITATATDGSHALGIEDSIDGSSGWVAVSADMLQGSLPTVTSANSNTVLEVGVFPNPLRPFLRAVLVTTGATTGAVTGAAWIVGQPNTLPVTH